MRWQHMLTLSWRLVGGQDCRGQCWPASPPHHCEVPWPPFPAQLIAAVVKYALNHEPDAATLLEAVSSCAPAILVDDKQGSGQQLDSKL